MLNKNTKMFLLFSLVLITMVGLTTITAADVDDTTDVIAQDTSNNVIADTPATSDNNIIKQEKSVKNEEESGTLSNLQTDINNAQNTLTLEKDYISTDSETPFEIAKNITIEGNGKTIKAVNGAFTIAQANTVTIKNLVFADKNANVPLIVINGNINLINVTFNNCSSTVWSQAGVLNLTNGANATLTDCSINNTCSTAAAISTYANTKLTVNNSNFSNIKSKNGAINVNSGNHTTTVDSCYFANIYDANYGAAIYIDNWGYTLINNTVIDNCSSGSRGVICIESNGTIENTRITNTNLTINSSTGIKWNRPDGIFISSSYANIYLKNNTITHAQTVYDEGVYLEYGNINSTVKVTVQDVSYDADDTVVLVAYVTDDNDNKIGSNQTVTFTIDNKTYNSRIDEGIATAIATGLAVDNTYRVKAVFSKTPENMQQITEGVIKYGNVLPAMTNYTSLQNVTDNQEAGSVVKLNYNITRADGEEKVTIDKDLTINGVGLTIDASEGAIFDVTNGATLTLRNVVLNNAKEVNVINVTDGNLVLDNVVFANSTATDLIKESGLISVKSDSSLIINNTKFDNITGIIIDAKGKSTTIDNTTIINSKTGTSPALIMTKTNTTILNSVIEDNEVYSGLIYSTYGLQYYKLNGTLTIDNTTFTNNTITQGSSVISVNNITTINNSKFIANTATKTGQNGAALSIANGEMNVTNSVFINNTAPGEASTFNIGDNGKLNISNSIILRNDNKPVNAQSHSNDDDTTTALGIYDNNYWGINDQPDHTRNNIIATQFEYEDYWDGEMIANLNVVFNNWIIANTTLTEDPDDNTIFNLETTFKLTNKNNETTELTENLPEGLDITYTATAGRFDNDVVDVVNNKAENVYNAGLTDATLTLSIPNQEFTLDVVAPEIDPKNYKGLEKLINATENGGTIELEKDCTRGESENNITITNKTITIDGNGFTIDENHGRLFLIQDANVTLKNLVIKNAGTTYNPSVLQIWTGNLVLENVTIIDSQSSSSGGALLYISQNSNATINNVTIENNTARFISTAGKTLINNSIIRNTNAGTSSLSYWGYNTGTLNIENTLFDGNQGYNSGFVTATSSVLNINNATFTNNTITSTGNGIVIYSNGSLYINNSLFDNNKVNKSGALKGLIYIRADATIDNTVFTNNTLFSSGTSSYSTGQGGAVYIDKSGTKLNVTNSTFISNKANNGTVIFNYYGSFNISNSIIIGDETDNILYTDYSTSYANNNWWGANTVPVNQFRLDKYEIITDNWVIMEATCDSEGDTHTVTTTFNKVVDTSGTVSDLVGSLPDGLEVSYSTSDGTLASETTYTENGVTTNTVTSQTLPIITVTQANQKIVLNKPTNVTITDETYPQYFDETGVPLETLDGILEIKLSGQFNNRLFTLTTPVNITTDEDQAVLKNSAIILATGVEGTNITNLIINNTGYDQDAITIMYTSGISIINNTIIQDNPEGSAKAIVIDTSSNLVIDSNNINVTGISKAITYEGYAMWGYTDTIAIQAYNSSNNQVTNNNISVKASQKADESSVVDTITAINFIGEFNYNTYDEIYSNNNTISNNTINIEGISYAYAIRGSGYNDENIITNNEITVEALNAYGIDISGPATKNEINNNTITVTAPEIAYGILLTSYMGLVSHNELNYNTINITANDGYAIELYHTDDNTIEYNTMTVDGNYSMGIGAYLSNKNTIKYNNITVTGNSSATATETSDVIEPETAGILFSDGGDDSKSNNNTISGNIIKVTDVAENTTKYAVTLCGTGNTVTNNTLIGTQSMGDQSVYSNESNTISNNIPTATTITTEDVTTSVGQTYSIIAKVFDINNNNITTGYVIFEDADGMFLGNVTLDENGQAVLETSSEIPVNTTITASYHDETGVYADCTNTSQLVVQKMETTTVLNDFTVKVGEEATLTAVVTDIDGKAVTSGKVSFKVNGKVLRDDAGKIVYATLNEDGVATASYVAPKTWLTANITANYMGTAGYDTSKSEAVTPTLAEDDTLTLNVTVTPTTVSAGSTIQISATVKEGSADVNAGKIIFKLNGKTLKDDQGKIIYGKLAEGPVRFSYTIPNTMKAGTYNLVATYSDINYGKLNQTVEITVA